MALKWNRNFRVHKFVTHRRLLNLFRRAEDLDVFYSIVHERNIYLVVMGFCGAGSVTDLVKASKTGCLKEDWMAYICRETLRGSSHLCNNTVNHRDIEFVSHVIKLQSTVKLYLLFSMFVRGVAPSKSYALYQRFNERRINIVKSINYLVMVFNLKEDDGLLIAACGLSIQRIFTAFLAAYCDPKCLVFVINTRAEEEQFYSKCLKRRGCEYLSCRLTFDTSSAKDRYDEYLRGGVIFDSSRILVVDLLKNKVPVENVTGVFAHLHYAGLFYAERYGERYDSSEQLERSTAKQSAHARRLVSYAQSTCNSKDDRNKKTQDEAPRRRR